MNYVSTRGGGEPIPFSDAVLTGLAPDGGLLVPASIPDVSGDWKTWGDLSYVELCVVIMEHYTDMDRGVLRELAAEAYRDFRDLRVAPLVDVGDIRVLELFHGPTLAFKDLAMQFLSRCFRHLLAERGQHINILGSTSGDTGSAAIHGIRGQDRMAVYMMHPLGRTSDLQRMQMTTVPDANVHNIAIEGTFDDCQRIMKGCFADVAFKEQYQLGAVNSVNWCRVLAQIVYHVYATVQTVKETGAAGVQIVVPSGNFGNLLAAHYARAMGLPIERLVCATNENDLLKRYFSTGEYAPGNPQPTISPSMDIQVASNFERYVHLIRGGDGSRVTADMATLGATGRLTISDDPLREAGIYRAFAGDTASTLQTIGRVRSTYDYVLDPHTAVGWLAAEQVVNNEFPTILAATAHPAKFPAAIATATGEAVTHPILEALAGLPERFETLPADEAAVRAYVAERADG